MNETGTFTPPPGMRGTWRVNQDGPADDLWEPVVIDGVFSHLPGIARLDGATLSIMLNDQHELVVNPAGEAIAKDAVAIAATFTNWAPGEPETESLRLIRVDPLD